MEKVTMTQIAAELGVSRSLVSYALKNKYGVSDRTKQIIVTKAIEMGYFKTPHATLKMTNNIVIIIGDEFLGEKSFFARIISGIEYFSVQKKFNPQIMAMKNDEDIEAFVARIIDGKPRGVIVIRQFDKKLAKYFRQVNFPMVFLDLIDPSSDCFEVRVNNLGNMHKMTTYLVNKGFDKFTFVGDISWALSFYERYNGYLRALEESGLEHTDILTKSKNKSIPFDDVAFEEYVRNNSGAVLVCANDSIAVQIYEIIKRNGKMIPDDFSVVGFDDEYYAVNLNPPLTTMHVPKFELGRAAFELLYEQLNYVDAESRIVCLNAKLVERHSIRQIK
ncbi:MAG: LacI family DNA-binding transcriptional regulator [Clostridia bacterium]|nr:LacI family DNA-binding transcriptional regulator [Clostridia bacterium]